MGYHYNLFGVDGIFGDSLDDFYLLLDLLLDFV